MNEEIYAKGRIFELVHLPQADGRVFEIARRAPGVRVIIADKDKKQVLLNKEFRRELDAWDYRLPGGKVFDSLDEYEAHRASGDDIIGAAELKAKGEAAEEAGVEIGELQFVAESSLGATVEWDLYVFESFDWHIRASGADLKEDEVDDIAGSEMYDYDMAKSMILDGQMQEERVALVLLRWLEQQT